MEKSKTNTTTKKMQGEVIKLASTNTIKVEVETKYHHTLYKKIIKEHKKYLVHCTDSNVKVGDKVIIEEGRPLSSKKSFYFVKILI
jgi:small subunit ribosomal protein S17